MVAEQLSPNLFSMGDWIESHEQIKTNDKPEMRNMLVDTGKGIAIILMCIGHAYCPDALFYFIYMFHMLLP